MSYSPQPARRPWMGIAARQAKSKSIRKIVVVNPDQDRGEIMQWIAERRGRILKEMPLINGFLCELPVMENTNIRALAEHPAVLSMEDDTTLQIMCFFRRPPGPAPSQPAQPSQTIGWGVSRIHAPEVWKQATGQGIKVAVLDTGIDLDHPDLKDNIKGGVNIIDSSMSPDDDNGHGSHVAGIIAGQDNGIGVVGVAPQASLYAIKAFDASGSGKVSDVIAGLDWAVRNGMQVVNMSFGSPQDSSALHTAVSKAIQRGVIMIVAAGNEGKNDSVMYPARYPEVLAVSATNKNDQLAKFSSRGPQIGIAAPGEDIYSTYKDGGYKTASGTSMATPHVTGTAALVLQKRGGTPQDVIKFLKNSAEKLSGLGPSEQGAGLVNARGAVNA